MTTEPDAPWEDTDERIKRETAAARRQQEHLPAVQGRSSQGGPAVVTYSTGCRCQPCRDEHAAYMRAWRTRKPRIDRAHARNPLRWHLLSGTAVCDPCLDIVAYAERVKTREYLARYRAATEREDAA